MYRSNIWWILRITHLLFSAVQLRWLEIDEALQRAYRWQHSLFLQFCFSLRVSFPIPAKPLKVAHSDCTVRLCFHNGSDVFSTPSSTPKTPSSWPPRPDSTGLGQTWVAGRVVSKFTQNDDRSSQTPCRDTCREVLLSVSEGVVDSRVRCMRFFWFSETWAFGKLCEKGRRSLQSESTKPVLSLVIYENPQK